MAEYDVGVPKGILVGETQYGGMDLFESYYDVGAVDDDRLGARAGVSTPLEPVYDAGVYFGLGSVATGGDVIRTVPRLVRTLP